MKGNPIYRVIGLGIIVSSILAHISGQIDFTQPTWLWIPIFMAVMMIQATFTGFCPMSNFFGKDPETGSCCGADTSGSCCTPKEEKPAAESSCCSGAAETKAESSCCSGSDETTKAKSESCCSGSDEGVLEIKVLGTGCANCIATAQRIEQQAEKLGVPVKIIKVEEIADIAGYGVMSTPGVVIHEKVVHSGSIPTIQQIEGWLKG